MGIISIRDLNKNISGALSRVEAGEILDVSRNGKVIAEIRAKEGSISQRKVRDAAWWKAYEKAVASLRRGGLAGKIGQITEDDKYGDAEL